MAKERKFTIDPVLVLLAVATVLFALHYAGQPDLLQGTKARLLYRYELSVSFNADADGISVKTFLPVESERQKVVEEKIGTGGLDYSETPGDLNRLAVWTGSGTNTITYSALISLLSVEYDIDPGLAIESRYPEEVTPYLEASDAIPTEHPELLVLWQEIKPADARLLSTVSAIYGYVFNDIESAPFKGFTDAVTAFRLKRASCNGKSRLFLALARQNGIPGRLVGGVILNQEKKKTSHQWVELYVNGHWVPFDPTNGHFAFLPGNYLRLYTGDQPLFTHTPNVNFDYLFDSREELMASALLPAHGGDEENGTPAPNVGRLLAASGMQEKAIRVFLLFPLCALIITFLRNVVGARIFGVFVPMLVAAACVYTGLLAGIVMFGAVLLFAFVAYWQLEKYRLLKVPRLAAIITVTTMLILLVVSLLGEQSSVQLGMMSLFPVVIISFLAERIHQMAADHDWRQLVSNTTGTLVAVVLCYQTFSSLWLSGLFSVAPELLLAVLAALIFIGRWSGIRLSEYIRFKSIVADGTTVGINFRNRHLISAKNDPALLELAIDKLRTKRILSHYGIPVAESIAVCESRRDLPGFVRALAQESAFVIKPNRGSQGKGIIVIKERLGDKFVTAGGRVRSLAELRQHVVEILAGSFAQDGSADKAFLEPLLVQEAHLNRLSNLGLADIRVIVHDGIPISSMLRLPTRTSDGKANLHQGAVGLAIDLASGETTSASWTGKPLSRHPDTGAELLGFVVPHWPQIIRIARLCYHAVPLGYLGVDICIDAKRGPLVLEVNGRPGLEIQNVRRKGLRDELELGH